MSIVDLERNLWEEAGQYWAQDARNVLDLAQPRSGVIIHSSPGTGKSQLLTPEIKKESVRRGFQIQTDSGSSIIYRPVTAGSFFLVDEAALISEEPDTLVRSFFDRLRVTESLVILINACSNEEIRLAAADKILKEANRAGFGLTIYQQQRKHLPEALVRTLLTEYGAEDDLIKFFLREENKALRNPGLFGYLLVHKRFNPEAKEYRTMEYFRSVNGLKAFFADESQKPSMWEQTFKAWIGGSTEDLARLMVNLEILGEEYRNLEDLDEDGRWKLNYSFQILYSTFN